MMLNGLRILDLTRVMSGPDAHLPACDLVAQSMSGLMDATAEDGGKPLKVSESFGDPMAGLYVSWAILAALFRRNATGEGATLDVAMFDSLFSLLPTSRALQFYAGRAPQRVGDRHPLPAPCGCFACADGQAVIAVLGDRQWQALCALIERADLATDPALASDEGRTLQEPRIKSAIEGWTASRPMSDVVAALSSAGRPTAQVQSLLQAASSPHGVARGLVRILPHPVLEYSKIVGQLVRFDGENLISDRTAPQLGADGADILHRLGITP